VKKLRRLFCVTSLILSGEAVYAGPVKTILVLGDSLSQGFGLAPSEAYPMLLAKNCAGQPEFRVINASAAGAPRKAAWSGFRLT